MRMNDTLRSMSTFVLALGCALARLPLVAATDPAANGPFPATRQTVSIPGTQSAALNTDLYYPGTNGVVSDSAGRCPVIVRDNTPLGAAPQGFLRLRVTQP